MKTTLRQQISNTTNEYDPASVIFDLTGMRGTFNEYVNSRAFKEYLFASCVIKRVAPSFGYTFSREAFQRFLVFAIWLRMADDEMEHNKDIGLRCFEIFETGVCDGETNFEIVTQALSELTKDNRSRFLPLARDLYHSVLAESQATNMKDFINIRSDNGEKIVNFAVEIFDPQANHTHEKFVHFFRMWVATGNLMDSIIDFRKDVKSGVYNFPVSFRDKVILTLASLKSLTKSLIRNPFMFKQWRLYFELRQNAHH